MFCWISGPYCDYHHSAIHWLRVEDIEDLRIESV